VRSLFFPPESFPLKGERVATLDAHLSLPAQEAGAAPPASLSLTRARLMAFRVYSSTSTGGGTLRYTLL
jgi:hypothetical protein